MADTCPEPARDEDMDLLEAVTRAVRLADEAFQKEGGGSRHWVRYCFLPELEDAGLMIARKPPRRRITTPAEDEIVQACLDNGGHFLTDPERPTFCTRCWFDSEHPEGKIATAADLRPVRDG